MTDRLNHPPHRVLVMEDELAMREVLRDALVGEGHLVELAADGHEGLDRLHLDPLPCIVLLDLLMPRVNGWQVAARMRNDPDLSRVPLVIISANPRHAADAAALRAHWLGKPLDLDQLFDTVNEVCRADDTHPAAVSGE